MEMASGARLQIEMWSGYPWKNLSCYSSQSANALAGGPFMDRAFWKIDPAQTSYSQGGLQWP